MFCDNFFIGISAVEKEAILEEIQAALRPTHFVDGQWLADYKRIRVMAIK